MRAAGGRADWGFAADDGGDAPMLDSPTVRTGGAPTAIEGGGAAHLETPDRRKLTRRTAFVAALVLALVTAVGGAAWAIFFSPVTVQTASAESAVAVQVFGLGTVEA